MSKNMKVAECLPTFDLFNGHLQHLEVLTYYSHSTEVNRIYLAMIKA